MLRLLIFAAFAAATKASGTTVCRCFPGDQCWPTASEWSHFNQSINGRLVATVPLATPCHSPAYNASQCQSLRDNWVWPQQHYDSSSSVMAPFFANRSCDPFTPESRPCDLGDYVRYTVNVSGVNDVVTGIRFAIEKNIRLVIRNTGHDYLGKSTGAGSLGLWMHHLKDIEFIEWSDKHYNGTVIKMGAGVQGFEAYESAQRQGLAVVGGECPTVGLAGGYTQGGGHSALASKYGLAADQVLEWEVVDGRGKHLVANRHQNSDLYWALAGGGGGTYAVVMSMTSKAHTDIPVSAFNLSYAADGISKETFYAGAKAWHDILPSLVDRGIMAVFTMTNTMFAVTPLTAPGIDMDTLTVLLRPFLNRLNSLAINFQQYTKQFPGYYQSFQQMQAPIEVGIAQYGGWLMPRSVIQERGDDFIAALKSIVEDGGTFIGVGLNVSKTVAGDVNNAVFPPWREALIDTVITTPWNFTAPWEAMVALADKMTDEYIPKLTALAPESGCYLNEADFQQPDFRQAFFGTNYDRLRAIKAKYDPWDTFYALTAVGSDEWVVNLNGTMCRAAVNEAQEDL